MTTLNRFLVVVLALTLSVGVSEARSRMMIESALQSPMPAADKALVVFLRFSSGVSGTEASIYETGDSTQRFLGIVSNETRVTAEVDPGTHRFMVIAENADFMEAKLVAGKTYYVLVRPRPGYWKARFSLLPIHNDRSAKYSTHSDDFRKWMKATKRVKIGPKAEAWYQKHEASVSAKRREYLEIWKGQPESHRATLTLRPDDGL